MRVPFAQRSARRVIHHQKGRKVLNAVIQKTNDIGACESDERSRLVQESVGRFRSQW